MRTAVRWIGTGQRLSGLNGRLPGVLGGTVTTPVGVGVGAVAGHLREFIGELLPLAVVGGGVQLRELFEQRVRVCGTAIGRRSSSPFYLAVGEVYAVIVAADPDHEQYGETKNDKRPQGERLVLQVAHASHRGGGTGNVNGPVRAAGRCLAGGAPRSVVDTVAAPVPQQQR